MLNLIALASLAVLSLLFHLEVTAYFIRKHGFRIMPVNRTELVLDVLLMTVTVTLVTFTIIGASSL